jgi:excisionase family DNA binding protein
MLRDATEGHGDTQYSTTPDSDQLLSAGMDETHHAPPGNDFATIEELCERFDVARVTVDGWIQSGELAHYRLGPRTIRISRADLDDFLARRRWVGSPRTGEDGRLLDATKAPDLPPVARNAPAINSPEDIRSRCSSPESGDDDRTEAA